MENSATLRRWFQAEPRPWIDDPEHWMPRWADEALIEAIIAINRKHWGEENAVQLG